MHEQYVAWFCDGEPSSRMYRGHTRNKNSFDTSLTLGRARTHARTYVHVKARISTYKKRVGEAPEAIRPMPAFKFTFE